MSLTKKHWLKTEESLLKKDSIEKEATVTKISHKSLVRLEYVHLVWNKKYKQTFKSTRHLISHCPEWLVDKIEIGNRVLYKKTRKISKIKSHIICSIIK